MSANAILENDWITVENEGAELVATNYWKSPAARGGKLIVSPNAGAIRLLVPRLLEDQIAEMKTGKKVWVSRGPWALMGGADGFEILFDDQTLCPFVLHLSASSFLSQPSIDDNGRKFQFTIWVENEDGGCRCVWRKKCRYRIVPKIPWMKP